MGKKITHIATVSLLICVLMLTACTLETSHNGALDGYWKLSSIDTLSTGGINDLTDASIFWSVQKNLLTVRDNNDVAEKEYVFSFNHWIFSSKVFGHFRSMPFLNFVRYTTLVFNSGEINERPRLNQRENQL